MPLVRYAVADHVATLTMDNPEKRNALDDATIGELRGGLARAKADEAVRCVVLASSHDRVWSAGGDLKGFTDDSPLVDKHDRMAGHPGLYRDIGGLGKPVVAAVNGHALAGAFGLTQACDLVVAAESATFGAPEITVGAFPFMISALIRRNVGRLKANELMLLGERLSAREAADLGLVNIVAPDAAFAATVAEVTATLTARSPLIMRMGKDAVERAWEMPHDDAVDFLRAQLTLAFATQDLTEGVAAFFEKREPTWTGR